MSVADSPWHYEINLAPSSQWAVYRFDSYRKGMSSIEITRKPEIAVRRSEYRLELDAVLRLDDLPDMYGETGLKAALAAVLEAEDGTLSYWALAHQPGKPDFHHADTRIWSAS